DTVLSSSHTVDSSTDTEESSSGREHAPRKHVSSSSYTVDATMRTLHASDDNVPSSHDTGLSSAYAAVGATDNWIAQPYFGRAVPHCTLSGEMCWADGRNRRRVRAKAIALHSYSCSCHEHTAERSAVRPASPSQCPRIHADRARDARPGDWREHHD